MNCQRCQNELATLLLDAAVSHANSPAAAAVQAHVADCHACAKELNALRATMALMDSWIAPEPTPFFDTRLHARLREEIAAAPAGFWERLRTRWAFNMNMQMKPVAMGALALIILAGGGSYAGFNAFHAQPAQVSAAVQDLQSLDKNEQTIATMDQILDDGTDDSNSQQNP